MNLAVPEQSEFLIDRAGQHAQRQQPKNPNESVDEQLPRPAAEIAAEIRRFNSACDRTTFPLPENRLGAIADGAPL